MHLRFRWFHNTGLVCTERRHIQRVSNLLILRKCNNKLIEYNTSGDPRWFLIFTRNNIMHVVNMRYPKMKDETYPYLLSLHDAVKRLWPLVTQDDLWLRLKSAGVFLYGRAAYTLTITTATVTLLETCQLQGFQNLTPGDLRWPLTFTKIKRVLLLNKGYPHANYHNCHFYCSWDTLVTSFLYFDPWWPQMTFDHQNQ